MPKYDLIRLNMRGAYHASIASAIAKIAIRRNYTEFPFPKKKRTEVYNEAEKYEPSNKKKPDIVVSCQDSRQGKYMVKISKKLTEKFMENVVLRELGRKI